MNPNPSLPAAPVEAAQPQPSDEPRFFIEHDTIHDRLTGRHVHGQRDFDPGSADAAVAMLNDLHRKAALFDAAPPAVLVEPAGFKLVPIEPTLRMLENAAIARHTAHMLDRPLLSTKLWSAMLAAAPAVPLEQKPQKP